MPIQTVPNYGLLQGLADGLKQGLITYQTQKNIQHDQQLQNILAQAEPDENGNLKPSAGLLAQRQAGMLKSQHDIQAYDPNSDQSISATNIHNQILKASNPNQNITVPEGMSAADLNAEGGPYKTAETGGYAMQAGQIKASAINAGVGVKRDALSEQVHARALGDMQKNPQLNALQTTTQNLQNAKTNFQNGGATTQEFNELQQAVRSNAGIKGSSGVGEREETYLKSLGINKDKFVQFLTGNPQSVLESDPAFAKQIMGLVDLEIQNKQKQAGQQISKLSQGHQSFYKKPGNEALADDYGRVVSDQYAQFGLGPDGRPVGQGLLNQGQPQGQGAQPQGQFTPDVLNYAKSHNITPQQAQTIKAQRTGGQ